MTKAPRRQTEEEAQINAQENEGGPTQAPEPTTKLTRQSQEVPKSEPSTEARRKRHLPEGD